MCTINHLPHTLQGRRQEARYREPPRPWGFGALALSSGVAKTIWHNRTDRGGGSEANASRFDSLEKIVQPLVHL